SLFRRTTAAVLLAAVLAPAARAKVAFTGYGHLLMPVDTHVKVRGPASVLGGTPEGNLISKGFRVDAVGLFATTKVSEDVDFLMDLTFRNIGPTVGQTRIQYAYLEAALPWWDLKMQAGRVNLPFNYYNTRRFYPFQRVELSAPVFVNGILGLPIADAGAVLARRFELDGGWGVDARAYAVNGYGSVSGSTASLRSPSLPGGLGLAGNLGSGNNNKDVAVGGQVAANRAGIGEVGASYYRGAWDREGRRVLQLAGAHALWTPGEFDLLAEYLHIHAGGDEGMAQSLGSTSWATHGVFLTASHPLFHVGEREVTGWGHFENYHSRRAGGGAGREVLRSYSGGAQLDVNDHVTLKAEALYLFYTVPTTAQAIILDGRVIQAAAVITF
ncbi:MAG: hypothetical protein NUW21_11500, partial [Elusimicrobia bacterium]|nr:hypothetical protein [Elusimicrobiota bacterium]